LPIIFFDKVRSLGSIGLSWGTPDFQADTWGYIDGIINQKCQVGGPILFTNDYFFQTGTIIYFVPTNLLVELMKGSIEISELKANCANTYTLKVLSYYVTPNSYKSPDTTGLSREYLQKLCDSGIELAIVPDIPMGTYYLLIGERYWDNINKEYVDQHDQPFPEQYVITNDPREFKDMWYGMDTAIKEYIVTVEGSVTDDIDSSLFVGLNLNVSGNGNVTSEPSDKIESDKDNSEVLSVSQRSISSDVNTGNEHSRCMNVCMVYTVILLLYALLVLQTCRMERLKQKMCNKHY